MLAGVIGLLALRRFHQVREHGEKRLKHLRVERLASFPTEHVDRIFNADRLVVRSLRHERIEVIDDREDAGTDRYLLALQTSRIARAVPPLVVVADERRDWVGEGHHLDDVGAHLRMGLDSLELLTGEAPRFRQDVLGNGDVADVVQQRGGFHALNLVVWYTDGTRQAGRVDLHSIQVARRHLVLASMARASASTVARWMFDICSTCCFSAWRRSE